MYSIYVCIYVYLYIVYIYVCIFVKKNCLLFLVKLNEIKLYIYNFPSDFPNRCQRVWQRKNITTCTYIYLYIVCIYTYICTYICAQKNCLLIFVKLIHLCPPLRSTFAVRETASLGIMGVPRVPPLNPSESIVL